MTTNIEKLREEIARAAAKAVLGQDYMSPVSPPDNAEVHFEPADSFRVSYIDQGETDFGKVADAILSLEPDNDGMTIADLLRMKAVKVEPSK